MTDQVDDTKDTNIFDGQSKVNEDSQAKDQKASTDQVANKSPDIDAIFKDQLSSIVDDKGEQKYKDPFTAIEALKYTQQHVRTLEQENRALRDKETQQSTLDTALSNITAKNVQPDETRSDAGLDAEKVKGIATQAIQELEMTRTSETNKKAVSDALVERYGSAEKAKEAYVTKAQELGLPVDSLVNLAATSPKAVLAYFGESKSNMPSKSKGNINTATLDNNKSESIDYTARFLHNSNPSVDEWRQVGSDLNNGK